MGCEHCAQAGMLFSVRGARGALISVGRTDLEGVAQGPEGLCVGWPDCGPSQAGQTLQGVLKFNRP